MYFSFYLVHHFSASHDMIASHDPIGAYDQRHLAQYFVLNFVPHTIRSAHTIGDIRLTILLKTVPHSIQ